MALIKRPKCGRDNVPESAEMCPNCGYGIKVYFAMIHNEKIKKQSQQKKLEEITMLTELYKSFTNLIFSGKFIIDFFCFGAMLGFFVESKGWFLSVVYIGIIIMLYYIKYSNYNKELKKYNSVKENFEKYQIEELHRLELNAVEELKLKCHQCYLTNIQRISKTIMTTSITLVEMTSGKMRKQYKCERCKQM